MTTRHDSKVLCGASGVLVLGWWLGWARRESPVGSAGLGQNWERVES